MTFSDIRMETRSVFITGDGEEFRTKKEAIEHAARKVLIDIVFDKYITLPLAHVVDNIIRRRGDVMEALSELED